MNFQFLGTSSGLPTHSRNVSGLVMQFDQEKEWLQFDCGEATQHQLLKTRFSPAKLSRIFITHLHGDHTYGLFGLLATRSLNGSKEPLQIIGPTGIKEMVETVLRISQCNLVYDMDFFEIGKDGNSITLPKAKVKFIKLEHSIETFAFLIEENPKKGKFRVEKAKKMGITPGPIYGKLKAGESVKLDSGEVVDGKDFVEEPIPGRKIIIAGDNQDPKILASYLKNCDLLVHEASYTEKVKENLGGKYFHSSAQSVASVSEKAGVKNLLLTHFSARFSLDFSRKQIHTMQEIKDEVEANYTGNFFLAKDLDEYCLNRNGKLIRKK